jgi:hypothetical protein
VGILGGGGIEMLMELLRSWQLSRMKREGRGGGGLAWPTTAASLQITMEIHISHWTHKFQNKTGLDAKANSELYKSKRVCSVWYPTISLELKMQQLNWENNTATSYLCIYIHDHGQNMTTWGKFLLAYFCKYTLQVYLAGLCLDRVAQGLAPVQPQTGGSTPKAPKRWFRTQLWKWPVQKVRISCNFKYI